MILVALGSFFAGALLMYLCMRSVAYRMYEAAVNAAEYGGADPVMFIEGLEKQGILRNPSRP